MRRFDPIPIVQPGGVQPYSPQGGREPGQALLAMLAGRTFGGFNPMDVQRSLLSTLSSGHNVTPGGVRGSADWMITPDQRDRNTDWWMRTHPPVPSRRSQPRRRSLAADDRDQNT